MKFSSFFVNSDNSYVFLFLEQISYIHSFLKNNPDERTDFTANILKWSTSFNANLKNPISTIGYPDIHREFALNNWRGSI